MQPRDVGFRQVEAGDRFRDPVRVVGDEQLVFAIVVARDLIRRRENLVHRRVEPAFDARADQLAADDEDERGGHDGHRHQDGDELGAEPRERQRPPPLDDDLDQVAGQHERQRREHRHVGGDERIEHELGEELGREAQAVGRDEHRHEHRHEHGDADEDETRTVAKSPARRIERAEHQDYSFGFSRSLSSFMNSPMSRKCRYTEAKRT